MDGALAAKSLPDCSLAELEAQITELAGQLNAANYRWLTLIGEFDRRQGWADGSLHSCAHRLNFKAIEISILHQANTPPSTRMSAPVT